MRFPRAVRRAIHISAGYNAEALVACQNQRTANGPDAAKSTPPAAAPRFPSRSCRSHKYANKYATLNLAKIIPVQTQASGSTSVGRRMNGESTAAAEEPHPGIPEATYGFQWNACQSCLASDIRVKYAVGGSFSSEFCASAGRTVAHGWKLEKTSFGDGTRPMNSVGKKKTKR